MEETEGREYVLTVGNIDKSQATLVDQDYNILELPKYLLPAGSSPGNVLRLKIVRDPQEEEQRNRQLQRLQQDLQFKQMGPGNKILEE